MRGGNYCRIGNRIADYDQLDNNGRPKVTTYESVNAAKRASRKMQIAKEGAIGRGCLYVPKTH